MPPATNSSKGTHAQRLAQLDTEVTHLSHAFEQFSSRMEARSDRVEASIERLSETVSASKNVDWRTILATCSLVFMITVTIGGTLTAWTTTQIAAVEKQTERNESELSNRASDVYSITELRAQMGALVSSVDGLEEHTRDRWTRTDNDSKTVPMIEELRERLRMLEIALATQQPAAR